jgi:hypothetical protein
MKTTIDSNANTVWHFTKAELVALLAHMSTDETRANLCALVLDTSKGRVWATDGHRMALAVTGDHDPPPHAVASVVLVPRSFIADVAKIARRDEEITLVCADKRVAALVGGKGLEGHIANAGDPPQIDQVIPQIGSKHIGVSASFCGDYLGDVALVTSACPPTVTENWKKKKEKRYPPVLMCPPAAALDPVTFKVSCPANQTDWTVLVMPMRAYNAV